MLHLFVHEVSKFAALHGTQELFEMTWPLLSARSVRRNDHFRSHKTKTEVRRPKAAVHTLELYQHTGSDKESDSAALLEYVGRYSQVHLFVSPFVRTASPLALLPLRYLLHLDILRSSIIQSTLYTATWPTGAPRRGLPC